MSATRRLYPAVFLASAAVLLLELVFTRLFSVVMWYHFASLSVAVALFGFAAGGVLVHLRPSLAPELARPGRLAGYLFAFAALAAVPFGLLSLVRLRPGLMLPVLSYFHQPYFQPFRAAPAGPDLPVVLSLAVLYAALLLPFLAAGLFFAGIFFRAPGDRVGSLYAADLAGAALGCLLVVPGLALLGAPSLLLVVAALAVVAGSLLLPGRAKVPALVVAGLLVALALFNGPSDRLARMEYARGQYEPRIEFSGWNALSRVVVYPLSRTEAEQTWGLSRRYGGEAPAMKGMLVDDAGYTPIMAAGEGSPALSSWAPHHVVSLPFLLRPGGSAFIIGPGGGRDILCAVGAGASRVTAVELNPLEVRAVQDVFGGFSGRPYELPQVEKIVGEGRSVAARRTERYDVLQASSVFGEVSPAAGAFSLSANFLYTREAFALYWDRLADDGVLSFSWSLYGRRVHRLTALARDLILEKGGDPAQSIAILRERGLATLLVRKGGFTPGEVACLAGIATGEGFAVEAMPSFGPGRPATTALSRVITGEDTGGGRFDLSPPTDDRPFFYNDVPRSRFFSLLLTPGEPGERHIVVLRAMGAVLALLTLLLLLLPFLSRGREGRGGERPPRAVLVRSSLFFLGIGLGYLLIELTVMQALVLFLGEPVLALSAVLASLLVFSGFGSWWAGRQGSLVAGWAAKVPILLPGAVILLNLGVWEAASRLSPGLPLPLAGKAALVFLMLAPGGFVMGCFMPLGLAAVGARFPRLVPWAWAVNGAASVMGSLLSLVVAMNFGYSRALWLGLACYLLTLPFLANDLGGDLAGDPAAGKKEIDS